MVASVDLYITKIDEVYCRIDCEYEIACEISEYFSFFSVGYQFSPSFKKKQWDGQIRLFDKKRRKLYSGLLYRVLQFASSSKYTVEIDPILTCIPNVYTNKLEDIPKPFDPKPHQLSALDEALRCYRKLIVSPTSSGKSFLIYLLIRIINKKTLIVVPQIDLVVQMKNDLVSYGMPEKDVHMIYSGQEKDFNNQFCVSTYQSLVKMHSSWFNQFGVVIVDEAHMSKSASIQTILKSCKTVKHRYGFTGTLNKSKTHQLILEGLFSEPFIATTTKKLIDAGDAAKLNIKCVVLKYPEKAAKALKKLTYQEEIKFLMMCKMRNNFICQLALKLKGNTLILFRYVDSHGKLLHSLLKKLNPERKVYYISGEVDIADRKDIRDILEVDENSIIVASIGTFSVGVNIKNLENVIFSSPMKDWIKVRQSIGRVLRIGRSDSATLYDIVDDFCYLKHQNYVYQHYIERLQIYLSDRFEYSVFEIPFCVDVDK